MLWSRMLCVAACAAVFLMPACGEAQTTPKSKRPTKAGAKATSPAITDWPQFRGPERDNLCTATGLLAEWPSEGPKLLWTSRELGRGYSGPAVVGDRLYIMGTEGDKGNEVAMCINVATGKVEWKLPVGPFYENGWGGGPRSTPTFDNGSLYVLAGQGDFSCLDAKTGRGKWTKNLQKDFGGGLPSWGYCESPTVDGNKVVVTPGKQNTMVALDKATGKTIWTSKGLDDPAHYASIVKATVGNVPLYITQTGRGAVGIHAETGELQWRFEKSGNGTATIPTPLFSANQVYATSGYGTGCGLVKLQEADGKVTAEEVYFNKNMKNHHGGVLLKDGHVYGYSDSVGWLCQNFENGEIVWREREKLGKGSIAYADNRLYCYSEESGTIVLAELNTTGWVEKGRMDLPEKTNLSRGSGQIWTHPVIANGKLFLRDQDLLFCFDITAK